MKNRSSHKKLSAKLLIAYFPILVLVTGFILLDTFVLPDAQQVVAASEEQGGAGPADSAGAAPSDTDASGTDADQYGSDADDSVWDSGSDASGSESSGSASSDTGETTASGEAVITDTSYQDENIQIQLTETRIDDTAVYIADVQVSDADYLKTAFAQGIFGRNIKEKTSETAAANNAILAINGDYYGFRDYGYVIRNGELYRSNGNGNDVLVIGQDGSFSIVNDSEVSAETLLAEGAQQVLSFGPALVENGQIAISEDTEVAQSMHSNPRTAIGIIDPLHYVFIVSDGRNDESEGLDLYQLAEILVDQGCTTAYNLDGGGSSTMVFNGQVVNNPSGGRGGHGSNERAVSDIIYIG